MNSYALPIYLIVGILAIAVGAVGAFFITAAIVDLIDWIADVINAAWKRARGVR